MKARAMWLNLRLRLLASFLLPMLVLVPLLGLGIILFIEHQVFLPAFAKEIITEGTLIARYLGENPEIWNDPGLAQKQMDRIQLPGTPRIDLFNAQDRLLATNQPEDHSRLNSPKQIFTMGNNAQGPQWGIAAQDPTGVSFLDVMIPITAANSQALGKLHLSRSLADMTTGLRVARNLVFAALLLGLLGNAMLGLSLSAQIINPLREATTAINTISKDGNPEKISGANLADLDTLMQAIFHLQEHLEENERNRMQILASLVHELGRPLGSLQIAAHALLVGAEEHDKLRLDLLHGMTERIEQLGRLVDNLAQAYWPQRVIEPQIVHFSVSQWLSGLAPLWAEMARHKGIEWGTTLPEDLPVMDGDPGLLEQAIGNLVGNAIKFTPPGGRVFLTAGIDRNRVWISISDNGPGISTDDLRHVFDPFFRAAPTAINTPGLGLGLSIARSIAQAHGGAIDVISQPGEGSRFTLCLPFSI
jgi:two-component system sensor histidine kinase BaeS